MNNKGYCDLSDFLGLILMAILIIFSLIGVYALVFIEFPKAIARRDYMLENPHMLVVSQYQRGGELPEITVNMKKEE